MDNWTQIEPLGESPDLTAEMLRDHLESIYTTEYQLPMVQFDIDGVSYVAMRQQDFLEWFGE